MKNPTIIITDNRASYHKKLLLWAWLHGVDKFNAVKAKYGGRNSSEKIAKGLKQYQLNANRCYKNANPTTVSRLRNPSPN
jgi:hypothetical protein